MTWKPHVTVAAVIETQGKYLCVEEIIEGQRRLNQPAGHLEPGENLLDAVVREVLEETRYDFTPSAIVGVYLWRRDADSATFLRVTFAGELGMEHPERTLDPDIDAITWLTADELHMRDDEWRSPLVWRSVDDYLQGNRFSLDCLTDMLDQNA